MKILKSSITNCLYLLYLGGCLCTLTPVLEISQGKLRGLRSAAGVNKYYGIPYATCKRFQPPKEPKKWKGVFNAVNMVGYCAQAVTYFHTYTEDCLQLDVYTPEYFKPGGKLPVLVFFHGGCYYFGSKSQYDPEFLVTKNVTAVVINYRLGVLGFLCLHDVANLGLKDQLAALKWTKRNIAAFGGDPDNVTIFGQSAGASSAAMHMLSEKSKGLFHKAILMSGNSLSPWAFNLEPIVPAIQDARKLATVPMNGDIEKNLYNIFAKAPLPDLLTATAGIITSTRYFKYSPCVDSNFTDPFLRDAPYNIIKSGNFNKVPILTGSTDLEGLLFYGLHDAKSLKDWDQYFVERLPSVFSWCSQEDRKVIAEKFRSYYFGKKMVQSSVRGIINIYSDWLTEATRDAFSNLMALYSQQPVYNYVFSYQGGRNFATAYVGKSVTPEGASHMDDIFYLHKPLGQSLPLLNSDKLIIERFTAMVTNFMKYGDPTPRRTKLLPVAWPPSTTNSTYVMRLDHVLSVIRKSQPVPARFFLDMLCTYGHEGYVPCDSKQQCNLKQSYRYKSIEAERFTSINDFGHWSIHSQLPFPIFPDMPAPPEEPPKWKGVYNAVNIFGSCAQAVYVFQIYNEDCLQLDVYTPEHAKPGDKLPVMVYIHGGAYYYGSKGHYDPEFLVTKNVVAVIVNYRLGVFGFLCVQGVANLGLKDQVAALKWTKKNIEAFGGDPDNITIFGQSAGASSAAMHMLSEKSKGLFHKAILMSGNSLTPWAFNLKPIVPAARDARKLATMPMNDSLEENIFNIFANASLPSLLSATLDVSTFTGYFKYSPCVDSNFTDPFFRDAPYNIIKSGNFNKVPVLTGTTDSEGLLFYWLNNAKSLTDWDQNFVERLPSVFSWCSDEDKKLIADKFRSHYFGKKKVQSAKSVRGVTEFYSDWVTDATADAFSHLMAVYSQQPVYNYVFSYQGERNFATAFFKQNLKMKGGATHSDDIFYIFKPAGLTLLPSESDKLFMDRLTTMFTNFMKHGNPTPRRTKLLPVIWRPSTANASYVMHLDRILSVTKKQEPVSTRFFLDMLCTYGYEGHVPCDSRQQCNLEPNVNR
ncbi:esterase FE4-like [Galleria mellonella]|uniref:Esterase FE4-like n=1 Tax=Galleria mellonella TaxID=7137 RepID=A0ABM3MWG3_GALME|nr:esterase FE4-like [Galleria mellonella]